MQIFKHSDDDVNGYVRYSLGVTVIIVSLTCVAGANVLNQMAQVETLQKFAVLAPKTTAAKNNSPEAARKPAAGIDYGATGAISTGRPSNFLTQPIILDPCTGKEK